MIARRLVVLLAGALATSPSSEPDGAPSPLVLCVSHRASSVDGHSPRVASDVVARAAYRQLGSEQRHELREALEESVSRREARVNPFGVDLEDGEPDARLERLMDSVPRTFGVARALTASRYCGSDGLCVRVTLGTCAGLEHAAREEEVDRARFLAWPYAYATRVRVDDEKRATQVADELRHRRDVALVLEGPKGGKSAGEDEVLALFDRRERLVHLERGSDGSATGAEESPWAGGGHELLVIPTLEAVASRLTREDRR